MSPSLSTFLPEKLLHISKATVPTIHPRSIYLLGRIYLKAWCIIASWILYYDFCMILDTNWTTQDEIEAIQTPTVSDEAASAYNAMKSVYECQNKTCKDTPGCLSVKSNFVATCILWGFASTLRGCSWNQLSHCQATCILIHLKPLLVYIRRSHSRGKYGDGNRLLCWRSLMLLHAPETSWFFFFLAIE